MILEEAIKKAEPSLESYATLQTMLQMVKTTKKHTTMIIKSSGYNFETIEVEVDLLDFASAYRNSLLLLNEDETHNP